VVIGYLCLVLVVLILLVVAIFCGCCIANPAFLIIMVVSLVVLTVTMWVAVGANLTLLIVVGDICNDPDMLIKPHPEPGQCSGPGSGQLLPGVQRNLPGQPLQPGNNEG
jgi:hypothetical protein